MSGSFANPHALTGGSGYRANPTYDEFLRKHSGFYRKHSAAAAATEDDRRASVASSGGISSDIENAQKNVAAEQAAGGRRSSVATGGAANTIERKGSIAVASVADRKSSVYGMEATAGTNMDPNRRNSSSLASDLMYKMKGGSRKNSTAHA